jgi:hypothetical protein
VSKEKIKLYPPRDSAYDPAAVHAFTLAQIDILDLKLGCREYLRTASAVVWIFAYVEVCRAVCKRCYASFETDSAKIMQSASIRA